MPSAEIQAGNNIGTIISHQDADWSRIRDGLETITLNTTVIQVGALKTLISFEYSIYRGFLQFDLSGIPFGTTIPAASLKLYSNNVDGSEDFYVVITKGYQSEPLAGVDFDTSAPYTQRDEVTDRGRRISGDFTPGAYYEIDFNAAGLNMLEAACGGTLFLCLRCDWDVEDTPEDVPNIGASYVRFSAPTEPGEEPYPLALAGTSLRSWSRTR